MNTPRIRHRKGVSATDKAARSRLRQLLQEAEGLLHGSLIRMARRCGNPNCRCIRQGQKHVSWYLGVTEKRKTRMKHLPKEEEAKVRLWVKHYQEARRLLDQMSLEAWKQLDGGAD
jgi:hypothetical protein